MENLGYSLNATVPVFLVMVVGYVLRRTGMLTKEFTDVANTFNFYVTLPLLLIKDVSEMDFQQVFDLQYLLLCLGITTLCFLLVWLGTNLFVKDKSIHGSFIQGSFRGSSAVLGLALIKNIYPDVGVAPLMIIGSVPLYNIFSVLILTLKGEHGDQEKTVGDKVKATLVGIATNPIIIAIVIGMVVSLLRVPVPPIVSKTVSQFAAMATPMALIVIGASFEGTKALAKLKPTLAATFIKLVLQTVAFLPLAVWLGYRGQPLVALLIMLAAPTTPSSFIMAKSMKNDAALSASIVVSTIMFSAFTLTAELFLLRSLSLI